MPLARPEAGSPATAFSLVRLTVTIWIVVAGVILVRGLIAPRSHSTYSCFVSGGEDWLAGKELYQQPGVTCRYSPLFHVFMVPFWQMPERLGSTLWRLLNWGVFLGGLAVWLKTFLPANLTPNQRALLFLLLLPLSIGSLNNAQANPLILGLMLLGVSAVAEQCWSLAGAVLAASILIKLYPVALALLLLLLYSRRLTPTFLLWMAVGLGAPYLLRSPEYVSRQYANWYQVLKIDDRSQLALGVSYRDVWLLIRLMGQPIGHSVYQVLQLAVAGVIAGLCWWRQRTSNDRSVLHWTLELGLCWMTSFGPATESCTYVLLAPTLAWRVLEAWSQAAFLAARWLVTASWGLFLVTMVANWFPLAARVHALGLQPLAGLLLFGTILISPPKLGKDCRAQGPILSEPVRKSA